MGLSSRLPRLVRPSISVSRCTTARTQRSRSRSTPFSSRPIVGSQQRFGLPSSSSSSSSPGWRGRPTGGGWRRLRRSSSRSRASTRRSVGRTVGRLALPSGSASICARDRVRGRLRGGAAGAAERDRVAPPRRRVSDARDRGPHRHRRRTLRGAEDRRRPARRARCVRHEGRHRGGAARARAAGGDRHPAERPLRRHGRRGGRVRGRHSLRAAPPGRRRGDRDRADVARSRRRARRRAARRAAGRGPCSAQLDARAGRERDHGARRGDPRHCVLGRAARAARARALRPHVVLGDDDPRRQRDQHDPGRVRRRVRLAPAPVGRSRAGARSARRPPRRVRASRVARFRLAHGRRSRSRPRRAARRGRPGRVRPRHGSSRGHRREQVRACRHSRRSCSVRARWHRRTPRTSGSRSRSSRAPPSSTSSFVSRCDRRPRPRDRRRGSCRGSACDDGESRCRAGRARRVDGKR